MTSITVISTDLLVLIFQFMYFPTTNKEWMFLFFFAPLSLCGMVDKMLVDQNTMV